MSRSIAIGPVVTARTPWKRLVGLIGRRKVDPVQIWFPRCRSVHTCFMSVPIDVVFLNDATEIVEIRSAVQPWRLVTGGAGATSVLEGAAGFVRAHGLAVGDRVEWR